MIQLNKRLTEKPSTLDIWTMSGVHHIYTRKGLCTQLFDRTDRQKLKEPSMLLMLRTLIVKPIFLLTRVRIKYERLKEIQHNNRKMQSECFSQLNKVTYSHVTDAQ